MMKNLCIVLLFFVNVCSAQQPVLTREAQAMGKGIIRIGLGAEYLSKAVTPFHGAPKSLWRLATFTGYAGVSDNVNFEIVWAGRLNSTSDSNTDGSDWGDVTIGTLITLLEEEETIPAFGVQTTVKLPSTRYRPYFLGSDQTDFYFSILGSKHFSVLEASINLGLGIIGSPRYVGSQDDIYILSTALLFPLFSGAEMFVEGYGYTGYRDDDDKIIIRSGVSVAVSSVIWNVYGSARAAGNNRDFGGAFWQSEDWSVGVNVEKDLTF